ncbi:MAG: undecaprenyldiphospho-muramoylpentapeptide beta-N-acetylglucosaminyltransferase [Chloroflexi bacterium]|nr:undecaprenyldiphospho-muramoylpentapeptide beta-N-acetylglucosaminyltransferase [Chloroflexota bacterium]
MRIAVTGGGTGGHVYPALSVVEALVESSPRLLFIGTDRGIEAVLARRRRLPFASVSAAAFRGRSLLRILLNLSLTFWGLLQTLSILRRFRPHVVLATGGYVCVPVVMAAWALRIPSLVYLPDVEPGWAVRLLARFASKVAVTTDRSRNFLPAEKVIETGYPVRPELGKLSRVEAREKLRLDANRKTLLVWGGSRGAHSINVAMSKILEPLLDLHQIIHLCGSEDEAWLQEVRSKLAEDKRRRYFLYAYLHEEFPSALAAADLAVSRAGASVLGEFPAAGLPSILVPYPHAGGHQRHNAGFLSEKGAASVIEESEIGALLPTVSALLTDDKKLLQMAASARRLERPGAAKRIASLLTELGQKRAAANGGDNPSDNSEQSLKQVPWEAK